jgi:hypothetical protein
MLIGPLRAAGTPARSRLAPPGVGHRVERAHALDAEHGADLQVVLQVLADAGQVAAAARCRGLQQLHRARCPTAAASAACRWRRRTAPPRARQCSDCAAHRRWAHLDAGAARAVGPGAEQQPRGLQRRCARAGWAGFMHRAQEGLGRVPAHAPALVDLEVAHALVVAAVEVVGGRDAGLLRPRERVEHVPAQALLLDAPLATGAVGSKPGRRAAGAAPVVLVALEVGQAEVPAPARVAHHRGPAVVVARLAAHVDHAVDAGAAAQHLAARVAQHAAVQARVRLGAVQPVGARVADAVQVADRDVDPVVVVAPAGLEQQHARCRSASAGWPAGSRPCRRPR